MIHPSLVRKRSEGAEVWPRLTVAMRSTSMTCCSTSVGLLKATAVRRSAPSTFCPRPVFWRLMSAASVPKAASEAVPQSTQAAAARSGWSGVPVEVGGAAHHLADAVEAVLVAPRAARAEGRDRREDDVGLDRPQAVEIERERAQHLGRQVGHDDVGRGDQLA